MMGLRAAALAAALLPGAAAAHDCLARVGEIEALLDTASEEAIAASSAGQAVAGARQAQVDDGAEEPAVPVQEPAEEAEALEQADEAGDAGRRVIAARAALQGAREMAERGDEQACFRALDDMIAAALLK